MNNIEIVQKTIDYVEDHLNENVDLDILSNVVGYSKYHLHRMFTFIVGIPVQQYIRRRKLTEAAKQLIFSDIDIIDIAFASGYEFQQAFTLAFKEMYKMSPGKFRKKKSFTPIQLKINFTDNFKENKGDRIMDIKVVKNKDVNLVGYRVNTKKGFFVIPRLWKKLHKVKNNIDNRVDKDFLVGLNDYSSSIDCNKNAICFDYFAGVEVKDLNDKTEKMDSIKLPTSDYIVFYYKGRSQDSIQPVMEYIYKEWFPQSTYLLNDKAKYDFVRYGEQLDSKKQNDIEVWIPIIENTLE